MKKKLVLKTKYRVLLGSLVFAIIFGATIYGLYKLDESFMKSCINNGYSEYYCKMHK